MWPSATDELLFRKTVLASENLVDIFRQLSRWQLDILQISCRHFRHIVSTMLDTVCLRKFASFSIERIESKIPNIPFRSVRSGLRLSIFSVRGELTKNGKTEYISIGFRELDDALEETSKQLASSAVESVDFYKLNFSTETLVVRLVFLHWQVIRDDADLFLFRCDLKSAALHRTAPTRHFYDTVPLKVLNRVRHGRSHSTAILENDVL